ncbi:RNA ligase RtcB family protein [Saccharophagus degradans]|uniref:RNA ligase RtcB family protein n=1 Tax=Saccharophagus degradans TaxID=86304 RepID=UPI001C09532F|nr:RNA ligase RtcB family protein [Saccharophagus degradans]MBU2987349.1 RNA ligase RtcB family protein [Saccharophagus degradans]
MGTVINEVPLRGECSEECGSVCKVRYISSSKNWMESEALQQLTKTSQLQGMRFAVGMPDLHPGRGNPIGAAFVTQGCIYPHLVGSDIGCGMGLWQLDVKPKQIKIDAWEKRLLGLDDPYQGEISDAIANINLNALGVDAGLHNLGTIGGGNHFAEFQKVERVFCQNSFNALALKSQSAFLLVHSGSRGVGQSILNSYLNGNVAESGASKVDVGTQQFTSYLAAHNAALSWAEANRQLIAKRFMDCIKTTGKQVLDVNHNTVTPLTAPQALQLAQLLGNKACAAEYWIHRKGASPTHLGPVVIPGSRGSLSYLVQPLQQNSQHLVNAGFSLAHGAGRKWKRSDVRGRLENKYKVADLENTPLGSRVVCKQRDLLYEEAPQAYKNIHVVIDDLVQAGVIKIIATLKPLLTYKTRRK